ncbi:MAG: rod shape-determining protein MreD [Gammaproteobacteria bacterium]|nr:rod shape-determining protein MreD [Gammaproteobacteria bacterium]MDP6616185.1 rod shape-determining protein MreD [Gammaproteobacteria bacterium]MDP6695607.1 rod shape-determining protein MreD [Gammaproteobacteria bacterium]MDP7042123.1 rod shape-determining protein MreD [Gammaproteobacteria bacterium]
MWPVFVAFVAAVALEVVPLPVALQPVRPPLPAMVLIYWAMMWPQRFGLGTAFIMGICLDILHGQLLGQNALTLSVVIYLTLRFHLQIRIFPLWQLTMTVFALLAIEAFLRFMIEGLAGLDPGGFSRWSRVLCGALFWPLVLGIMDRLRTQVETRDPSFN